MKCPNCDGTGRLEEPVAQGLMGLVDCEVCEGTGSLPDDLNDEIIKRLDRIIELLEQKGEKRE